MADQDVANDPMPTSTPPPTAPVAASHDAVDRNGSVVTPVDTAADRLRSEFAGRVSSAWARFASAVGAMRQAADAMQENGRPPSYRLLHALGDCHRDFLRLRHEITARARDLSLPLPPLDTLVGIGDLVRLFGPPPASEPAPPAVAPIEPEALDRPIGPTPPPVENEEKNAPEPLAVEAYAPAETTENIEPVPVETAAVIETETTPTVADRQEAPPVDLETPAPEPLPEVPGPTSPEVVGKAAQPGESVRQSALAVLDTVLRLVVRDGSDFPPLNDCRSMALALRERVAGGPPSDLPAEAVELAQGAHALAGLLKVVSGAEGLSDSDWAAVHAGVTETFGRPLAVAAARGRLKLAPPQ